MKKIMLPLSLLALASLGACSLSQNSSTPQGTIGTITKGVTANLSSSEMAYAFAGASSINFLDDALGEEGGEGETVDTPVEGDSSSTDTSSDTPVETPTETPAEQGPSIDIDVATRYLKMYEELTNEENFAVYEVESDNPDYVYCVIIKAKDSLGEEKTYSLYFNEVVLGDEEENEELPPEGDTSNEEVPSEEVPSEETPSEELPDAEAVDASASKSHKHHGHRHEGEDTLLNGIIVDGENTYEVYGKREEHRGRTETEFRTFVDENTRVIFSQETSEFGVSYEYEVKQGRRTIAEYEFETFATDGFNVVSLEKYVDGVYSSFEFASFVIEEQEYFQIVFFEEGKEFGYVYAKVNYDENGNKQFEYLYSDAIILPEDDFWHGGDHDDYWEDHHEFDDHEHQGEGHGGHGYHHGGHDQHH